MIKEINLTENWEATNVISLRIKKHWYTTKEILNNLVFEGKAEKLELGRNTYWRKK